MTSSAADKLRRQIGLMPGLLGRGPVSYDYGRWADGGHQLLVSLFGADSAEVRGFLAIIGEGAEARGWGLPLAPEHPWGMQARLRRAETYLRDLLASLGSTPAR